MNFGGGVLLAAHKSLKSKLISATCDLFESLFVEIRIKRVLFIVSVVYVPPTSNVTLYQKYLLELETIHNRYTNAQFIICGDFNVPEVEWDPCTFKPSLLQHNTLSLNSETLITEIGYFDFFQLNYEKNHKGRLLDLVLSNSYKNTSCSISCDPLLKVKPDHPPLCIKVTYICSKHTEVNFQVNRVIHDFKKGNYIGLRSYLADIDWERELNSVSNINVATDFFYMKLNEGINKFIPKKNLRTPKFPLWFSDELRDLILIKKQSHVNYKATGRRDLYFEFSNLREQCKRLSTRDHANYVRDLEKKMLEKPREIWSYLSSKKNNSELPQLMKNDNIHTSNGTQISNLFAENFKKNYSSAVYTSDITDIKHETMINIHNISFSFDEICTALIKLTPKACMGPDGISYLVYKLCAPVLVDRLKFYSRIPSNPVFSLHVGKHLSYRHDLNPETRVR